jgi:diacylglycerol kinase family enzyme
MLEFLGDGQSGMRIFTNFAGIGFDAEVVRATTKKFKNFGGKPAYLMGLLSTFATYKNREVKLILDGHKEDRKICTVMMSNGKYGGGSMMIAPEADPCDGLFDVMIIGDISKPNLLMSLPRIYRGTHLTHPQVTLKRAKNVEIRITDGKMAIQADGELVGQAPARFTVLPLALNILV